ncbi:MAG: mannose-1-phosphate guanylyltransferase [Caulobacteraceae bacterium]|nr:mannose-1-phosphate guanylyltransferase [Caulobacteraceae bacterium]
MKVQPVILCGGGGVRLWPASRPDKPKPFLSILGDRSLYQQTLLRLDLIADALPPIVVTGQAMLAETQAQAAALGRTARFVVEPEGRDSGPAIAAAAALIAAETPDAVALMMASDHHIAGDADFSGAVAAAVQAAGDDDLIVTFGVRPTGPATAYGYIRPAEPLTAGVRRVSAFVEKPDLDRARAYVAEGLLWNSGNLAFRAEVLLAELERFDPAMAAAARAAVAGAARTGDLVLLDRQAFAAAPRRSIDYALMEKTQKAAVVESHFEWSDLGAWDAIWAAAAKDADGNVLAGPVATRDARGLLVRSDGPAVAVAGVSDLVIVAEAGGLLICPRDQAQQVRGLVDALGAAAGGRVDAPVFSEAGTEVRLWRLRPGIDAELPAGTVQLLSGAVDGLAFDGEGFARLDRATTVRAPGGAAVITTSRTAPGAA